VSGGRVLTRWVLPLSIGWAELLLAAFVFSRLPPHPGASGERMAATFLGVPMLTFAAFGVFRIAAKRNPHETGRSEDLAILWILAFLFGVHALVLAMAIGMLRSLQSAMPIAICVLLMGLGPVMAQLEPNSAMGIRTKLTLSSGSAWTKVHRVTGALFATAGVIALVGLWFEGWMLIAISLAPALLALLAGVVYGSLARVDSGSQGS
jgi:uncharacterized membrane protein